MSLFPATHVVVLERAHGQVHIKLRPIVTVDGQLEVGPAELCGLLPGDFVEHATRLASARLYRAAECDHAGGGRPWT